jgi:hypothetical protein
MSFIESKIIRINQSISSMSFSNDQLQQIKNDINNLSFFPRNRKKGAAPFKNRVSQGDFKLRSNLVKSFKKSLKNDKSDGRNNLYEYIIKLQSKYNIPVSVPFYNNLVVDLCNDNQGYINELVLPEIDNIIKQPDRVKLFYIHFLEKIKCIDEAKKILNSLKNKDCYRYFSYGGNLLSRSLGTVDDAIEMYKKAIDRTDIRQHKAKDFNNIARSIWLHKLTDKYEYAIDCCEKSIKFQLGTYFFYPLSLKIALKIEQLPSIRGIKEILSHELIELNGNKKAIKEMQDKVRDISKKNEISRIIKEFSSE